ncbi:MAG: hypothetical protein ACSLEW_13500 [Nocardioides sp.]
MSTPAVQLRQRITPWIDAAAAQRARLSLVQRPRVAAPRFPFILLLSVMLVGGVVGLLCFNTQMQQAAFVETNLRHQASVLAEQQESLTLELQQMSDPQQVAEKAQRLGLVIPSTLAWVDLTSGEVTGTPTPATGENTPRLWSPVVKPDFGR